MERVSVHRFLVRAAELYPHKKALVQKDRTITYRYLDEAADRVASFLLSIGIEPGDRVGIFSAKCIEEVVALFAVFKIGAIAVHVNPHVKEVQLRDITNDCQMKLIFLHKSKVQTFNKFLLSENTIDTVVTLSSACGIIAHTSVYDLRQILHHTPERPPKVSIPVAADTPAAIIYTSGATGKAKGVIVTRQILHDAAVTSAQVLENNPGDRLISVTPFSFDGALNQLTTSIYVGGTLVLQDSTFPRDIVKTMVRERITGFHAMPSFWRLMLHKHSPLDRYQYPWLRYISIIGEVFPRHEATRLKAILKETKFFMMYGVTEAFRSTCLHPDDFEHKPTSAGKPLPGVEITVVDENLQPCKPGVVGEIVHKGAFVSPGYWNDRERTEKVFKDGCFFTGDLGKIDDRGYIYFVGRKDTMIKSMGYRICPEEIEECLRTMPGVLEAAVTSVVDRRLGTGIKALVVPQSGYSYTWQAVVDYCKSYLPHYMVPRVVEFKTQLPKTATFKINKAPVG